MVGKIHKPGSARRPEGATKPAKQRSSAKKMADKTVRQAKTPGSRPRFKAFDEGARRKPANAKKCTSHSISDKSTRRTNQLAVPGLGFDEAVRAEHHDESVPLAHVVTETFERGSAALLTANVVPGKNPSDRFMPQSPAEASSQAADVPKLPVAKVIPETPGPTGADGAPLPAAPL